jgi:hypothetical protein
VKPEKVYREIDWSLLVLFIGLFIVIAGIEKTSLPADLLAGCAASRCRADREGRGAEEMTPLSTSAA